MVILDWASVTLAIHTVFTTGIYWLLIIIIMLDFITGTAKALLTKDVSSSTGISGLIKHSIVILLVTVMSVVSIFLDVTMIGYAFALFYTFEYIISVIENLDTIGVKFPEPMRRMLRQWKDQNNDKWGM